LSFQSVEELNIGVLYPPSSLQKGVLTAYLFM